MLKLYFSPGACSLAPHIILQESGLAYETVGVDLKAKTDARGGDFRKINPKGSVPALQLDNGEVLTEGPAIQQYIADQSKNGLIPEFGTWERYRCLEWLNYVSTELHKGFAPLFKPDTPDEYKEITRKNLSLRFDFLEKHFEKNKFLLGESFSVADAYLFTVLNWSGKLKIDLSPWRKLSEFVTRIRERPSTIAAMRDEKLIDA